MNMEMEKDKSEESKESKEDIDSEIEEFYTFHTNSFSLVEYLSISKRNFQLQSDKLTSQVQKEITTPPPNS